MTSKVFAEEVNLSLLLKRRKAAPRMRPIVYGGKKTVRTACGGCEYRLFARALTWGESTNTTPFFTNESPAIAFPKR